MLLLYLIAHACRLHRIYHCIYFLYLFFMHTSRLASYPMASGAHVGLSAIAAAEPPIDHIHIALFERSAYDAWVAECMKLDNIWKQI